MAELPTRKIRDLVRDASQAHCDLNILYGVIALLEGGTMSAKTYKSVQRIISICKIESGRCLTRYDRATAKIVELSS